MPLIWSSYGASFLLTALVIAVLGGVGAGQPFNRANQAEQAKLGKLGTVNFPTSCSQPAQARFLRGVAALHSFWYPVAIEEFRESTKIEPDCMMGYWGEAMAHNHPIWGDPQETEAARKALEKIRDTPKLTPRERAWLQAVRVLYGEGDKSARDKAYAAAMEKIYRDYPDDAEAALFYALSLMGTVRAEAPAGVQTRLRAGAIASEVYKKNPDHPGAAHYVIHAYDDPEHAEMALDAARRYAEIAPEAPHALHMPSHIFLQLGMWPEAAASNEASWAASEKWVKRRNLPISQRDYHSLYWLMYVYLQQGRYGKAEEQLAVMRRSLAGFPKDDPRNLMFGTFTHAQMAATFVTETEKWDAAEQLLGQQTKVGDAKDQIVNVPDQFKAYIVVAQIPVIFARGMAAATKGSADVQKSMAELRTIRERHGNETEALVAQIVKMTEIQELEISAVYNASKGGFDEAVKIMRRSAALEAAMPPPLGPPGVIKPAHELFGEILLRAKRPKEAAEQFATSLRRHKNRARSLLGSARAAAQSGDTKGAVKAYAQFSQQWRQAGAQAPELREAQDYLKQAAAR
jgi:tetratricopeptide (TPR) repeat protein